MIELNYSYADFGLTILPFYKESEEIINFLEKAEHDGLRHFERLDHLGRIRDAHRSAHHSRWDYMFLQMYLFHKLKETGLSFGFSGGIKLDRNNKISSSEELLKCWTLLLNFGHLEGTFECERAWFEIIKENKEVFDAFLKNLPDDSCRKIAVKFFDRESYYKFFEIIALLFLNHYRKIPRFSSFPIEKFILILKKYVLDNPRASAINRCKNVFRRVRRIAYVLLDCSFSSSFMKINPKIFFDYILMNSNDVLYEEYSSFNRTLNSVEMQLFNELYASKEASLAKINYLRKKKEEIQASINMDKQDFIKGLPEIFLQSKHSDFTAVEKDDSRHLLRLSFLPSGEYFERSDCTYYTEQKRIVDQTQFSGVYPLITPTPGSVSGSILDIFLKNSLPVGQLPRFIWALLKYTESIFAEWEFDDYIFQGCVEDPVEDIFLFLLNVLFANSNFKFRFKDGTSPDDYNVNLLLRKRHIDNWKDRITDDIKSSDLSISRKKEMQCLKTMIKSEKTGIIIVSHCNITVYDKNWSEKTEWDGVYFRVLSQAIYINILESKAGMTARSQMAKNDLLASFDKVGLKIDVSKIPIFTESVRGKGVGFSYLKSNLKTLLPVVNEEGSDLNI